MQAAEHSSSASEQAPSGDGRPEERTHPWMLILTFTVLSAMALEGALMVRARAGLVQTWAKTHVVGLHTADPP